MSQKKTLAGFHFHWSKKKRKNLKKKAHIETQSLCQVLNVYDCKASAHSKQKRVRAQLRRESSHAVVSSIVWLFLDVRKMILLVYTNSFSYMSKKNLIKLQTLYFYRFLHVFQCIPSQCQAMRYYGQNLTCSRPSQPGIG